MNDLHGLRVRQALEFSTAELASITTAAFDGYVVPLAFTAESFEAKFRREDIDGAASRVLMADGRPVAIVLVARRGWTARVAAMGVVPGARGRGAAALVLREVVEELRASGTRRLVLEVVATNEPALRLYKRLGFRKRRKLVGYRRAGVAGTSRQATLAEVDPNIVARRVADHGHADLPWLMAPENLAAAVHPARGYALSDEAFAIVEPAGSGDIVIRTLVVARQARGRGRGLSMVDALASRHEGQDLIVSPTMPADLVPGFMGRAGFEPTTLAQFEMELDLTSQAGKPG